MVVSVKTNGIKYDGCTHVPDFTFGSDCCNKHDYLYQTQSGTRAEADKLLRQCISSKGYPVIAWVYWLGVRLFGRPYWDKHAVDILLNSSIIPPTPTTYLDVNFVDTENTYHITKNKDTQ